MEFRIWVEVYLAGRVLHRQLVAQVEREATGIGPEEIGLGWRVTGKPRVRVIGLPRSRKRSLSPSSVSVSSATMSPVPFQGCGSQMDDGSAPQLLAKARNPFSDCCATEPTTIAPGLQIGVYSLTGAPTPHFRLNQHTTNWEFHRPSYSLEGVMLMANETNSDIAKQVSFGDKTSVERISSKGTATRDWLGEAHKGVVDQVSAVRPPVETGRPVEKKTNDTPSTTGERRKPSSKAIDRTPLAQRFGKSKG
jgi:hypothetical protein